MIEISLCHSGGAAPLAELENDDIDQKSLKQRKSPSKSSKLDIQERFQRFEI